jgi:uncharacterized membrane protein
VAISVASLVGAFVLYDQLWRTPLARSDPGLATAATLGLVLGAGTLYFNLYSGRAAYVHMGVLIGTLMTGNVWFCILPSQRELIAATVENRTQDPAVSFQAKQRSVHNNYFTFPLLFVMLSGHFPSTFGGRYNWQVLTVLALASASIRHLMNLRFGRTTKTWLYSALAIGAGALVLVGAMTTPRASRRNSRPVPFADVRAVIERRCVTCHSAITTDPVWRLAPSGVMFDSPEQIAQHAQQIRVRVVGNRTMPLNNQTHITDDERNLLGDWVEQGAKIR